MMRSLLRITRRLSTLKLTPPSVLVIGYAILIALGAVLLKLPVSTERPLSWSDALFTSASAVTVTGLAVVDTGTHFSGFGQFVILLLIQLGGLGLMTSAVVVFAILGMKMPIRHQLILSEDLNQTNLGGLVSLAWTILRIVLFVELAGALLLSFRFVGDLGVAAGIWNALFHSVSAFNNAGFGLHSDSLSRWVGDPIVNLVIPVLFVVGGLGFAVVSDIYDKRAWHTLTLHSKLMIAGTGAIIAWSVPTFMFLEWSNPLTLGKLPWEDKILATWFQALTTRTAGFNTIDIAALRDSTSLLFITLMLIGGGATSTAGGLKVTTFVVLILATHAFLKRKAEVNAFGRSLHADQILKVLAIATLCLLVVITSIFLILVTNQLNFLDVAFEVASAFGTVGLSRGITAELDPLGRGVIILVMFIGRVGPLALGFLLATRLVPRVRYPSAQVFLG